MKNLTFTSLAYDNKKKTRLEQFLEEMNQVIPWTGLTQVIEPYYSKIAGTLSVSDIPRRYLFIFLPSS
jgi:transposase, IS5 family